MANRFRDFMFRHHHLEGNRLFVSRRVIALAATIALTCQTVCGKENDYIKSTAVYKTVGDLSIHADVYRPSGNKVLPVVVWIHGGALINGHRESISRPVRDYATQRGFALVSIDYRLAPESQLPQILDDIEDAFRWIRDAGAKQYHLDPNRIAVTGGSAGGYLTLATGYRVQPRPQVLIPFWGYGDLVGPWYSTPSIHPRHNRSKPTREEALRQVSGPPIADSRERKGNGGLFYIYCRQTGQWPRSVSGWDPHNEPEEFYPFMPFKNVDSRWPPTLMIHGTDDTDVPHEQSVMMAREFSKHNVQHKLVSIDGGEHGLSGGKPDHIKDAYRQAYQFLDQFLIGSETGSR